MRQAVHVTGAAHCGRTAANMEEASMDREKQQIIDKLKANGCRITKQRMELLDIILETRCSSCKEIYYQASKKDETIGIATVYRMVNALEEVGVLSRRIVYESSVEEKNYH